MRRDDSSPQQAAQGNRLEEASSPYLRAARAQPVHWFAWGEEAFAAARREDKPILLDVGAVWCHWCHVMDRESYEDPELAELINDQFIAIKVDRDERPDVDARYQAAVSAISGQGGWPVTAFLTPAGEPYFGGTYFPPEERFGRPSFGRVLLSMADAYRNRRAEVEESAGSVMQAIEASEIFSGAAGELGPPLLGPPLLDAILQSILAQFDPQHGGFGAQPKFPHATALDLLLDAASRPGALAAQAREAARVTLLKMADGGIYDHLAGGFHRYAVDERWIVPHFEKMLYDNSELLRVYVHAFQTFAEPRFAEVAADILRWMETMSDRQQGGFYASQVADASLDDEGDFYTWTRAEAEAVLSPNEFAVAAAFYNLRPIGDMHHNPAKNVLHVVADVPALAARVGLAEDVVQGLLRSAKEKLYAARLQRPTPFIDRTVYTGWNALCVSAYLAAGRVLARPEAIAFALKSLDRVLATAWEKDGGLLHVVAYQEPGSDAEPVRAVLEDYASLGHAALDAWKASGEGRYVDVANQLAEALLERFLDTAEGGFFDVEQGGSASRLGALAARRKPLQDAPTPAGNPAAASLLLRLEALNGQQRCREEAQRTLELFSGIVKHLGLSAASYAQALRRWLSPAVQAARR